MNTETNTEVVVVAETKKKVMKKVKTIEAKPKVEEVEETKSVELPPVIAEPVGNSVVAEMVTAIVVDVVDEVSGALSERDEYDAMMRDKIELDRKIRMYEDQKKIKKNIRLYRDTIRLNQESRMRDIQDHIQELEEELNNIQIEHQVITEMNDSELVSLIMSDEKFMRELGFWKTDTQPKIPHFEKKLKKVMSAAPKEEGTGRRPAVAIKTMKPADRWALIDVGTQFRAKQKDFIKYYKKTDTGVVECDCQGRTIQGSITYAGNQEAANAFRIAANIPYSISGWEFLQLYNPITMKAKSLKTWNGELEYLNW